MDEHAHAHANERPITYIIDTREQRPYALVPAVRMKLVSGDYSAVGYAECVAVERKTLADLVGTLSRGRRRFEAELGRLARYAPDCACVVIESRVEELKGHRYRSMMAPEAVLALIGRLEAAHGLRFHWAGDRVSAARFTAAFIGRAVQTVQAIRSSEGARHAAKAG